MNRQLTAKGEKDWWLDEALSSTHVCHGRGRTRLDPKLANVSDTQCLTLTLDQAPYRQMKEQEAFT